MNPYQLATQKYNGKKILIFGLGLLGGGVGDARFFASLGARVRVTDQKDENALRPSLDALASFPIEYTLGLHDQKDIEWADVIVKNPSIPDDHPLIIEAQKMHKVIKMRSSLFVELASKMTTIGITGTRGKTTTTMMIYELARKLSSKQILLGGNIAGVSDLELLQKIKDPENTIAIMELSSWQLHGFNQAKISPNSAVITNVYPDHLNRYKDLNSYFEDKRNIVRFQTKSDFAVLNFDQPEFLTWSKEVNSKLRWFTDKSLPDDLILQVPGTHNRYNAAAALEVAKIYKWPLDESLKILANFKGVPFRLETIAIKNGITYINDTTSTTPIATIRAIQSFESRPILICGGNDKNLPIQELAEMINTATKEVVLLPGTGTERLKHYLDKKISIAEAKTMQEAVHIATKGAQKGDLVLLSPGFTSFGLFNNEFDRGEQFNQCVANC